MKKATQAILGECRLSYVNLLEPQDRNNTGKPRYSVTLLIPKDSPSIEPMKAAIEAAIQEGVSSKFGGQRPANPNTPVYDGDGVRPNGEEFGPECAGCYVLTANRYASNGAPQIVAGSDKHIAFPEEVYSGAYGYVSVNFFPYNSNGRKGIGCGLNNVLISRDGEPLAGTTTAAEDFKDIVIPSSTPTATVDPITGMPINGPVPTF